VVTLSSGMLNSLVVVLKMERATPTPASCAAPAGRGAGARRGWLARVAGRRRCSACLGRWPGRVPQPRPAQGSPHGGSAAHLSCPRRPCPPVLRAGHAGETPSAGWACMRRCTGAR
jgi:hypothetical protein